LGGKFILLAAGLVWMVWHSSNVVYLYAAATCIIIAPKRLKLRLSGSARKSRKRFRDTPMFKFQAVLARTQPFLSRSVEKRGDQSRFESSGLYTSTSSVLSLCGLTHPTVRVSCSFQFKLRVWRSYYTGSAVCQLDSNHLDLCRVRVNEATHSTVRKFRAALLRS
jgi:hypothetical protein